MPDYIEPQSKKQAQDPAMVDLPYHSSAGDLPVEEPQPEPEPAEPLPQAGEDPFTYSGEQTPVGDSRRLEVFGLKPDLEPGRTKFGEAWQEEDGSLQGTGMLAVMLFESVAKQRYLSASLARDLSPLAVLEKRLARASWFNTDFVDDQDE